MLHTAPEIQTRATDIQLVNRLSGVITQEGGEGQNQVAVKVGQKFPFQVTFCENTDLCVRTNHLRERTETCFSPKDAINDLLHCDFLSFRYLTLADQAAD